jgi:hypothetical protein
MVKLLSTLSNISKAKPSLPSLITTIKNNPKSTLALSVLGGPVAVGAVLAVQHKAEIKSTLSKAAETVKHEAGEIKHDTISAAHTVKDGVGKAAKVVSNGIGNLYMYGMLGVGAIILLKFVI